jgi:flagellar biosynthesis/type III secretory pathway M-ring protein FliF/YscJ
MDNPIIIFLIVFGGVALIALVAFIIYRTIRPRLKEEKPSEEEILQDEMKRVLQDVEDENVAKQISDYKDDE